MVVLFNAGVHTPVYPLIEVVGKGAIMAPEQIGITEEKAGIAFGVTVMVSVVVKAH